MTDRGKNDNDDDRAGSDREIVHGEPIAADDRDRLSHLLAHRSLIVKRTLLATALSGALPIPILDEYFGVRVRAGLFMKLAQNRHVDLPAAAAEVLAEGKEGSSLRNLTITAASLVALKLAWRKFFALLAAGRGTEEAATTYQVGLLFDHYCARLHVGPAIDKAVVGRLRGAIFATVASTEKAALSAVFRDGGTILGRSFLQAPRWASRRVTELFERWMQTGGDPEAAAAVDASAENALGEGERRFLDKAAQAVETRLAGLGNDYITILVDRFESAWTNSQLTPPEASSDSPDQDPR